MSDKMNPSAREIVAIHNAIARAGIDWRKLEEDPDALKDLIEWCWLESSTGSAALDEILDRLIHTPWGG